MPKLTRKNQKPFALDAATSNVGQFGSLAAESIVTSKDPDTIQALEAWPLGLSAALVQVGNEPGVMAMQDMNGVLLVAFYQLAYLLQTGMAEWSAGTTYYENSYVQVNGTIYRSKTDDNVNNDPVTDPTNWEAAPNANIAGAIYGGVPSNNALDPTFRLDFTKCQAKDSTGVYVIQSAAMSKNVTDNWGPGSGNGGLDEGTIGSSAILVGLYQIGDSSGIEPGDFIMSKSLSAPTLPDGYNLFRYLGARRWNGTAWDQFITCGNGPTRQVALLNPIKILSAGLSTVFADIGVSSYVDVNTTREINVFGYNVAAGNSPSLWVRPKGSSEPIGFGTAFLVAGGFGGAPSVTGMNGNIFLSAAGVFQYAVNASSSADFYLKQFTENL